MSIPRRVSSLFKNLLGYGVLGGMVFVTGSLMVIELGIALHITAAKSFVAEGMQLGEAMWAMTAITMIYGSFSAKAQRREPLWLAIVICSLTSSFAICSQLTIKWKVLMPLSQWANVVISFVFVGSLLFGLWETIYEQRSKSHPTYYA
jgi:hypothetical protein